MGDKVAIAVRALVQRINRKLAPGKVLKSNRRSATLTDKLGEYYVLDLRKREVAERDVNLVSLARKLRAIEAWEELADG